MINLGDLSKIIDGNAYCAVCAFRFSEDLKMMTVMTASGVVCAEAFKTKKRCGRGLSREPFTIVCRESLWCRDEDSLDVVCNDEGPSYVILARQDREVRLRWDRDLRRADPGQVDALAQIANIVLKGWIKECPSIQTQFDSPPHGERQ